MCLLRRTEEWSIILPPQQWKLCIFSKDNLVLSIPLEVIDLDLERVYNEMCKRMFIIPLYLN